ncbi:isopenicillin N synthase-like dioxygenase [Litorimonas taeanensis]|uniref:2-oxoglutarate-dependent ethylene/succinate-forming enzyme n=1 Tax=Litorimonas taeanensis TaxID=568099 RepID=A0A420WJP9_9PROT|nr:2-oxoglutarate and iron-dependent oxygenase domain-containing protein [Litorimonas taeanensis]RKQ71135.1 isopenicillin N synthase-like dioxygenase [Litorimonas taeanensis]
MIEIEPISFSIWQKDKQAFAKLIGDSFRETGFAIISDHTISSDVIESADKAAIDYFALPAEVKKSYADPEDGYQRGHSPMGTENAKGKSEADLKEFWHTGRALPEGSPYRKTMKDTPHVAEVPGFDAATRALYESLDAFGVELLRAIALYLDLEENWFDTRVDNGNSILRLLHYPPQLTPPPEGTERAGAHEDINLITLLLGAEEAGLQAKHRSGQWLDVNAPNGAVVVNSGDMLQRLTGGVLPSTTHRVLNPAPERAKHPRYSKPYFLHPNNDFKIEMLESCKERGGVAETPITASEFLTERLIEIGLIKA